jgi:hypothetical protein
MLQEGYYYTLDPYPLESQEFNKLYKFYDNLRDGRLTTTLCRSCGHKPWPPRTVCPECLSDDLEWVDLPTRGRIYTWSLQEHGLPLGFTGPIIFVLVDLEDGTRVFSRLLDASPEEVHVGDTVELAVMSVPGNRVLHSFRLAR